MLFLCVCTTKSLIGVATATEGQSLANWPQIVSCILQHSKWTAERATWMQYPSTDRTFLRQDRGTRYFESQMAKGKGNDSSTMVVRSMFNYCWWKGHFVWRTWESGISESDFLVLGCLTKSACNPLENFARLAFSWLLVFLWAEDGMQRKRCALKIWGKGIQAIHNIPIFKYKCFQNHLKKQKWPKFWRPSLLR